MFRGSKMAAWAGSADILRASSVKTAIKNTGIKCVNNPYSAFLTDKNGSAECIHFTDGSRIRYGNFIPIFLHQKARPVSDPASKAEFIIGSVGGDRKS